MSACAAVFYSALLCACAATPSPHVPTRWPSADYETSGSAAAVRAFVYGKRTVLAFDRPPLRLTVQDDNGVPVPYEREGPYYRLSRQLDRFTVWTSTRILAFNRIRTAMPATQAAVALADNAAPAPLALPAATDAFTRPGQQALAPGQAIAALAQGGGTQRDAICPVLAREPDVDHDQARLARIEAQHLNGSLTTLYLPFEAGATQIKLDEQCRRVLIGAAMAAAHVNIEGHTQSLTQGRDDLDVALARAQAVRAFLIAHGVEGRKITVAARSAGDFLVPSTTEQGRALDRSVDTELAHQPHAH